MQRIELLSSCKEVTLSVSAVGVGEINQCACNKPAPSTANPYVNKLSKTFLKVDMSISRNNQTNMSSAVSRGIFNSYRKVKLFSSKFVEELC